MSRQDSEQLDRDLSSLVPIHPLFSWSLLLAFHTYSTIYHTSHWAQCNYFLFASISSLLMFFCFSQILVPMTTFNYCPLGSFIPFWMLILVIRCIFLTIGPLSWRRWFAFTAFMWFAFIGRVCAQVTEASLRFRFMLMRKLFLKLIVRGRVGLWKRVIGSVEFITFC